MPVVILAQKDPPSSSERSHLEASGGPGGEGVSPAVSSPQDLRPQVPLGPPHASTGVHGWVHFDEEVGPDLTRITSRNLEYRDRRGTSMREPPRPLYRFGFPIF